MDLWVEEADPSSSPPFCWLCCGGCVSSSPSGMPWHFITLHAPPIRLLLALVVVPQFPCDTHTDFNQLCRLAASHPSPPSHPLDHGLSVSIFSEVESATQIVAILICPIAWSFKSSGNDGIRIFCTVSQLSCLH